MFADLLRALLAGMAAGVLPGYFWAMVLRPSCGLAERLTWSAVLSMASVPPVALVLARLAGTGVTLWAAIASVAVVAGSGGLALILRGAAPGPDGPALPRPPAIRNTPTLALMAGASVAAFASVMVSLVHRRSPSWLLIVTIVMLAVAGAWAGRAAGRAATDGTAGPAATDGTAGRAAAEPEAARPPRLTWRAPALTLVLGLIALRAYAGAIRLDWPYLRGSDQFSYVVMSEQMLSHGSYGTFLIYPPGFSTLSAVICRLSGLTPLTLFPVLAPALLLLTGLAAYTLATRLWGWEYGIAAAALSGLVLDGAYAGFGEGRYPDLVAAFFLMVMFIAALVTLYRSATLRSGTLVTVVGASVVLYHPVVSMYLGLMLAVAALICLPYLLLRGPRRDARVLLFTLLAVTLLAVCYAAYIYNLGKMLTGSAATSTSVAIDLGTQAAPTARHLLLELRPALVWPGLFGVAALAAGIRYLRTPPQVLAAVTVVAWCVLMYAGSRTALDGFPTRFERDLGAPLSVTGALGIGLVLRSLVRGLTAGTAVRVISSLAAALSLTLAAVLSAATSLLTDSQTKGNIVSPPVAAAGKWLGEHNTGGTIITTPWMNYEISNRAVLAMGGYTGLQSYPQERIQHPRSLPPAGRQPLLDSQEVLLQPESCQSAGVLARDDVRYVVLYKSGQGADLLGFRADPARYHLVFEDATVVIYAAAHAPCGDR